MGKYLRERKTGDVYPWSESWAKDVEKFEEIDQLKVDVPDPVVTVDNGQVPPVDPKAEKEPAKEKK